MVVNVLLLDEDPMSYVRRPHTHTHKMLEHTRLATQGYIHEFVGKLEECPI